MAAGLAQTLGSRFAHCGPGSLFNLDLHELTKQTDHGFAKEIELVTKYLREHSRAFLLHHVRGHYPAPGPGHIALLALKLMRVTADERIAGESWLDMYIRRTRAMFVFEAGPRVLTGGGALKGKALRSRLRGQRGFTLVELLVVIIIIAILSAIAIPTYLGQRTKGQDAAAKSLVRSAATAIEAAYSDTQTFATATMTSAILQAIEPSIAFTAAANEAGACQTPTALAAAKAVNYFGSANGYQLGSKSASGNTFGIDMNKSTANDALGNAGGESFYVSATKKSW